FREPLIIDAWDFIGAKSVKARGKRLTTFAIEAIEEIEPRPVADISEEQIPPEDTSGINAAEETETVHETSDEEVRDEINGQTRIF
ncbi:MAG: hypothetical protein K2F62_02035, partial [Muribaculaceae bacterium]|nr:hypothetical protein [Muribaculaceae bacterium]